MSITEVQTQDSAAPSQLSAVKPVGRLRWLICGLIFLATTINYIDRQVFAILSDKLSKEFQWSERDYGMIVASFQFAYAVGYLVTGRLMDVVGVRWGLPLAVLIWSWACGLHGLMSSVFGFCAARVLLGLSEGGNFPAAVKTVGEWFPKRERALATGIFNSGSNVGMLVAAIAVPIVTTKFGWPAAFFTTAVIGACWLLLWIPLYRPVEQHRWLSIEERKYIQSDPVEPAVKASWIEVFGYRQTWAFAAAMFLVTPVWVFYNNWLPKFFQREHSLDLIQLGAPLIVIYLMTDVGSIAGGWLSSHFIGRGWKVSSARRMAMLCCALLVVPVFIAPGISSLWPAVLIVGLAASAHQGFMANMYTVVTDTMPGSMASSVVGIGGMVGSLASMIAAWMIGVILDLTHSYYVPFLWASMSYLSALGVIYLLMPKQHAAAE
jgi:ACS family hexuronate transporter-like MFS transporter